MHFTLRTLFIGIGVLTVILARQVNQANRQKHAADSVRSVGGWAVYDYEKAGATEPSAPPWLRRLIGNDYFSELTDVYYRDASPGDDDLKQLESLDLEELSLGWNSNVTDGGLRHLRRMRNLRLLHITGRSVTDDGMAFLSGLTGLEILNLGCPNLTDDGLRHLTHLSQLKQLNLDMTQVTDAGLGLVRGFENLDRFRCRTRGT